MSPFECAPAEESRLLPEEADLIGITAKVDAVRSPPANARLAAVIDDADRPAQHIDVRVRPKRLEHEVERALGEAVIGVEISQYVGIACRESLVQAVGRSLIRFEQHPAEAVRALTNELAGTIRTTGIDDD